MEVTESRYAHLLKPIRELTQNWEIDVASELNDYLEELEEMSITIDGGFTMNFAEAALLIQGSAHIYSKKVELLHNLVYQTLEYINDRDKKRAKQAATSAEDDADQAESNRDEEEEDTNFRSLDCKTSDRDFPENGDSTTNVYVPPLPPEALIPFEPREKQKAPLISLKGEDIGSWRDFRINTYIPNAEDHIDIRFKLDTVWSKATGENWRSDLSFTPYQGPDEPVQAAWNAVIGAANDMDAGDDGGGSFLPLEDNGMEMDEGPREHIEGKQAQASDGGGEGRVLRERPVQPSVEEQNRKKAEEAARKRADIWKLHDPYEVIGESAPLKPGKCYVVPEGLDGGKRKRKVDSQIEDFRIFMSGMIDPPEQKLRNGPMFTDLNYIYVDKIKEKLSTRKRNLRRAGVVVSEEEHEELRKTCLQPEVAEQGDHEDVDIPIPGGDDDDCSDGEHEALPEFDMPGSQTDGLSYEDLVKKHVDKYLKHSQDFAKETELSRRVAEWEEKVRPVLELQETRDTFDIHDYGSRIVESLGQVEHRKSFSSIVCGLDNFEACKYMLASLQLANDYTVEIDQAEGLEESLDTMALTLLSTDRATDRFKNLGAADA